MARRIAIIDHNEHELLIEDINEQELVESMVVTSRSISMITTTLKTTRGIGLLTPSIFLKVKLTQLKWMSRTWYDNWIII